MAIAFQQYLDGQCSGRMDNLPIWKIPNLLRAQSLMRFNTHCSVLRSAPLLKLLPEFGSNSSGFLWCKDEPDTTDRAECLLPFQNGYNGNPILLCYRLLTVVALTGGSRERHESCCQTHSLGPTRLFDYKDSEPKFGPFANILKL